VKMTENDISFDIRGAVFNVHTNLGPGLLESVYEIALADVHHKQLLTYLKLSGKKLGLLINFNVALLKEAIVRIVNNL